jgi:hypothetical protein
MLIRNYGLFWNREKVYWGRPNSAGNLLGKRVHHKTQVAVDFRNQAGVYILYDDRFKIVYVGQTGSKEQKLFNRLKQHTQSHLSERWKLFSWFGMYAVSNYQLEYEKNSSKSNTPTTSITIALNHIEAVLIASTEPPLNLKRGTWGNKVEKYLQFSPEDGPCRLRKSMGSKLLRASVKTLGASAAEDTNSDSPEKANGEKE